MNDFYKDAIETLEILVRALNGNKGYRSEWRHDTYSYRKNSAVFNRNRFLITRRKILPCNR